jgi:hypothetical protein
MGRWDFEADLAGLRAALGSLGLAP